ncbi:uncharacterized protein LOC130980501 [Arachis stenosperma]|uniref:uncharacterized protein LOC130980501 n=1 Tax=Arachis stenosperma TaxID=217475 RepID=UPI0025AD40D8|nr:uncharacterized protein LOC130980501 [Arachis stenosperma]
MEIEELREADKTERRPRKDDDRPSRSANTRDLGKPFKLTPKFDNYTRFNTKREKIIKEILNAKIIKPPTRAGSYQDQRFVDKSKHYAFHQKYGHTTDECVIAKDLLERLARQGLLDKYIEGRKHRESNREEHHQTSASKETNKWLNNNPPKGVINYISGGFAGGGETNSARKRSYRAMLAIEGTTPPNNKDIQDLEITFNQADICSAAPHTDDPVVISIQTGDLLVTYIGQALRGQQRSELIKLLQDYADLFAWTPADMPGISPDIICHKLATNKTSRPIAQKKRNLGTEKSKAALEETEKLLKANFIKEIRFTTWLSNVVMVRKNSSKWRMCVDFSDLNKACPKDAYPLPCIDKLVDNASGFNSLSFMDAYSGYNQILMHPEDQSKTAFITEHGNFCYRVMPFGLKNAGATYQRLMDKVFRHQIGRNIEIYVDDMVAKSTKDRSHCDDLKEIFEQIRAYNMRLNPEKCAFGVQGGKFLGFMLTSRGIEANPEKCKAILNMTSPKTIKEFQWTPECETAFGELKTLLSSPPVLQRPEVGKPLYLYLSVSNHSISSALVIETGRIQQPVYFVSRVMQPTEQRYPKIEQLALALVVTARRLRHYFQSHTIVVRTNHPLRQILTKLELAGRLTKWSIELSEFDIQFQIRSALKAQVLADFITEMTPDDHIETWELHVDGASSREGSGAGIILKEGSKVVAEQALQFHFSASNNQAEYEALIAGLKLALSHKATNLTAHCDSLLVVQQIRGEFQVPYPETSSTLNSSNVRQASTREYQGSYTDEVSHNHY